MSRDFDVTALPPSDHPEVGETAPDFTRPLVTDEFWENVPLSALTDEGPVVLVFYPMDGSPTAVNLWSELRKRDWQGTHDVALVGVSVSNPYEHKAFIDEQGLDARLFSDPTNEIATAYDVVYDTDGMAGITEGRPAVFVLDTDRTVTYAWTTEEWPAYPEYDAVERAIERL